MFSDFQLERSHCSREGRVGERKGREEIWAVHEPSSRDRDRTLCGGHCLPLSSCGCGLSCDPDLRRLLQKKGQERKDGPSGRRVPFEAAQGGRDRDGRGQGGGQEEASQDRAVQRSGRGLGRRTEKEEGPGEGRHGGDRTRFGCQGGHRGRDRQNPGNPGGSRGSFQIVKTGEKITFPLCFKFSIVLLILKKMLIKMLTAYS